MDFLKLLPLILDNRYNGLNVQRRRIKKGSRMFKTSLVIIGTALAALLWYASPIFKPFPKPTGPFSVGTTSMEFTDSSRREIYSENPNENRTLVVRFYYPALNTPESKKYPFLGKKMPYFQQYMTSQYHLTATTGKLLFGNITTHAYENPPLANAQAAYPVILFSHGGFGFPSDMYSVILENLASHGYIVAAIDHPYFNGLTLYANGKLVTDQKLSNQFSTMTQTNQKAFLTTIVETFKSDMKFLVHELITLNEDQNNIFYHHFDLDRIGVMGHSAGGSTAIEFCRIDNRCKAAVDLDGWYDHVIGQEPINKPLLLIFAEKTIEVSEPNAEYLKRKELTREQYFEREINSKEHREKLCSVPTCSMLVIPRATHGDFDNHIFLKWPLREWNEVEPYTTIGTLNTHILNFFDRYLK